DSGVAIDIVNDYDEGDLSAGTNYNAAAQVVRNYFANASNALDPSADQNLLYFLTDGDPNSGQGVSDTTAWQTFLNNNIDRAFSIGFSGLTDESVLEQMAPREQDI